MCSARGLVYAVGYVEFVLFSIYYYDDLETFLNVYIIYKYKYILVALNTNTNTHTCVENYARVCVCPLSLPLSVLRVYAMITVVESQFVLF